MSSPKIGIISSGGGMKCAYSNGVLEAIAMHYKFRSPHTLIAASGSAGGSAYYVASQYQMGRKIWYEYLTGSQLISYLRWPILNIDHLVYNVFKKKVPLDAEAVRQSSIHFLIPVISLRTGHTRYVTNRCHDIDIFDLLAAAKRIPIVGGRPKCITKECPDKFIDGDIAGQLNQHIKLARDNGNEKIIVISNQQESGLLMRLVYDVFYLFSNNGIRKAINRGLEDRQREMLVDEDTIVIRPSKPLNMHSLSRSRASIERAFEMGYSDAVNNPFLQELFTYS